MARKRKKRRGNVHPVPASEPVGTPGLPSAILAGAGARSRLSMDRPDQMGFGRFQLLQQDAETEWRRNELDTNTLGKRSPERLIELLCDVSPDISRALWDFLRMMNAGWEVEALNPTTEEKDERAQAILDAFVTTLLARHTSLDILISRLHFNAWLRGAFFAELVLDKAGRVPLDIATPDSRTVRFEPTPDVNLGEVMRPYQQQAERRVYLDVETIRYLPIDPFPGQPYGRGLALPALFSTLFSQGLMRDLRRVVSQQGYPRIDVKILMEQMMQRVPAMIKSDPVKLQAWVDKQVNDVRAALDTLEPDDAYVHTDNIEVGTPVGTIDSSSLGAVEGIFQRIDRQAVRGLKTLPVYFGINDSTTETHANRQVELLSQSLSALQHLSEALLEHLFGLALRVQGVQATVRFRFALNRRAERLRDAQTKALEIRNALLEYAAGWISQEEAAREGADIEQPDQEEPRIPGAGIGGGGGGQQQPPSQMNVDQQGQQQGDQASNGRALPAEALGRNGHAELVEAVG